MEAEITKATKKGKTVGKKRILQLLLAIALIGGSAYLLKGDVWTFWTWWLLAGVLGLCAMPLTGRLFQGFADKGWIFSKALAIAVTGFFTWFLVSIKLAAFTTLTCVAVVLIFVVCCIGLFLYQSRKGIWCMPEGHGDLVFWEEVIFFAAFLMWTYFAGFHPQAYGTEKFMDYGFMEAMMRSTTLPATDLWYSQGKINYYYGGQYFAVFLTKLSVTKVAKTYNLMRTFVAAFAFAMPFSLVYQMVRDRMDGQLTGKKRCVPPMAGLTAGISLSLAGNGHYIVYKWVLPWIQKLQGVESDSSYWFPDATRYIGYNPYREEDRTIHEFPSYSFVLGDLHAHVVNILFVLLLIGILYAWMKKMKSQRLDQVDLRTSAFWKREMLSPYLLLAGLLLGMYQWTNFWDFVIYFVVTGGVMLFGNIVRLGGRIRKILAVTIVQALELLAVSYLVILPFTIQFDSMVDGVGIAKYHSYFYQLLVLWGIPVLLVLVFVISLLREKLKQVEHKSLYSLMAATDVPDLFALITGLCAFGLILIPELVYVRDIYENGNARANTMFKLTYQAYILFALTMGYGIYRLLIVTRNKLSKVLAGVVLFFLVWTFGYLGNSVKAWFGDVWKVSDYQGLDATTFLEQQVPEDAAAIRWLRANITGSPVVLEAPGDSYTKYERVSAATGLPTVIGWRVHEWLWRSNVADVDFKAEDVRRIYTSTDEDQVKRLLTNYDVSYIFVGSTEREKYGDSLNESLLQSLGTVVFQDETYDTYIIKVDGVN
mgnify:FL=1